MSEQAAVVNYLAPLLRGGSPDSSGRNHISLPLNGTYRALLGAEAGRVFTAQLLTAGASVEGKAIRSPAKKKIHGERGGSASWGEGSHITGNQKCQE